jgi:hypothetical protein
MTSCRSNDWGWLCDLASFKLNCKRSWHFRAKPAAEIVVSGFDSGGDRSRLAHEGAQPRQPLGSNCCASLPQPRPSTCSCAVQAWGSACVRFETVKPVGALLADEFVVGDIIAGLSCFQGCVEYHRCQLRRGVSQA